MAAGESSVERLGDKTLDRCCTKKTSRGFTLVELMVVLAMIAILALIGIPSFSSMQDRNRIKGATEAILSDFRWARSEAIKRNESVTMDFTEGANWSYSIYVSSPSATIKRVSGSDWTDTILTATFTNSTDILIFDPVRGIVEREGGGIQSGNMEISSDNSSYTRKMIFTALGRSRIED